MHFPDRKSEGCTNFKTCSVGCRYGNCVEQLSYSENINPIARISMRHVLGRVGFVEVKEIIMVTNYKGVGSEYPISIKEVGRLGA